MSHKKNDSAEFLRHGYQESRFLFRARWGVRLNVAAVVNGLC